MVKYMLFQTCINNPIWPMLNSSKQLLLSRFSKLKTSIGQGQNTCLYGHFLSEMNCPIYLKFKLIRNSIAVIAISKTEDDPIKTKDLLV